MHQLYVTLKVRLSYQHKTRESQRIEKDLAHLVNDVDGIVYMLTLYEGVVMVEEHPKVVVPIPVRHYSILRIRI